jgi:hypothetical protein
VMMMSTAASNTSNDRCNRELGDEQGHR